MEVGTSVAELCRTMGVTEQTYYNCRKKYGEGRAEVRELRMFGEENCKPRGGGPECWSWERNP